MKQEINELLEEIEKLKLSGKLVIVEGKKDKAALDKLGIVRVRSLDKALFIVAEEVSSSESEVVILTDLDVEGRYLYGRLSSMLKSQGVRVDDSFRNFLLKNTQLRQIEGLSSYIRRKVS